MAEEHLIRARQASDPIQDNRELLAATGNPDCIFMHCLPSFHDFETDMAAEQLGLGYDIREVTGRGLLFSEFESFRRGGNRLHTIKAVLVA
jgi:ornithine carbamoyltransferase